MSDYRSPQIEALALDLHRRVEGLARHTAAIRLLTILRNYAEQLDSYKRDTGRW